MNDNINVGEIKEALESSDNFNYWHNEVGITFDDFDILDIKKSKKLINGKKDIGSYCIFIQDSNIQSVQYDLTVKCLAKKRLSKLGIK